MDLLVALSRGIDAATRAIGRGVAWLVVAAILISAGNAIVRKAFDTSSNAWLELQWWLFGAIVLFAAPWTLALNEHIRIDALSNRLSRETRNWIEVIGIVLFLMPVCVVLVITSWWFFLNSAPNAAEVSRHLDAFQPSLAWLLGFGSLGEQSSNAGGLPQWPAKGLIPLAFALLFVQAVSELIKRAALMMGEHEVVR